MSSPVEQIKERLSIVDVISSYVKLEKAGINYKARCPFHNEKTPSFFVSTDRNTYYCFGCAAKGDIFTFLQEYEGLTFREALVKLAERAGIVLTNATPQKNPADNVLYDIMESAVEHFEKRLKEKKEVCAYLAERGITDQTISEWRIGYALGEWQDIFDVLSKKYREVDIKRAGLIKYPEERKSDRPYDTFRDRIMFPIMDLESRTVAFSGRIFGKDPNAPKYLNSPETEIFKKSETLYGLHKAKAEIRKKDFSLLVEGQFDLVMMHQVGIKNTVATSGTAFTIEHAKRLKKYSNRILLAFDGDNAGIAAALRAGDIALKEGMEVKVVSFPEGEDPASLGEKNANVLKEILKASEHLIDFRIKLIEKKARDVRSKGKMIKDEILPLIFRLDSSIEQSHFIKKVSNVLDVSEQSIIADLKKIQAEPQSSATTPVTSSPVSTKSSIEKKILGIIFWLESSKKEVQHFKEKLETILGKEQMHAVLEEVSKEKEAAIFEAEQYYGTVSNIHSIIEELLAYLEEDLLKEDLRENMRKLKIAEKDKNKAEVDRLIKRMYEKSKKNKKE